MSLYVDKNTNVLESYIMHVKKTAQANIKAPWE